MATEPRVLVYVPANQGVKAERVFATKVSRAHEILDLGAQEEASWYAGATIIEDVAEYPRYGYKECPVNGVVRDDASRHYTEVVLERRENDKKRHTVSESTESAMKAQMIAMQAQMDQMAEMLSKSQSQLQAEDNKAAAVREADLAAVKKKTTKKKKE